MNELAKNVNYVTGTMIKELREQRQMTQKELADLLMLSDKTISKWETGRGLPDISLIEDLSKALRVSVAELLTGRQITNTNRHANMKNVHFYVCPVCGNVIQSIGEGAFSCCGIALPELEAEEADVQHSLTIEIVDDEYEVSIAHDMRKEHYISFIAYVTTESATFVKMYPEQEARCRFKRIGHGIFLVYCNRHGLYSATIGKS